MGLQPLEAVADTTINGNCAVLGEGVVDGCASAVGIPNDRRATLVWSIGAPLGSDVRRAEVLLAVCGGEDDGVSGGAAVENLQQTELAIGRWAGRDELAGHDVRRRNTVGAR